MTAGATAVQTSEPDLFRLPGSEPHADCTLEITGTLACKPHVALKQVDREGLGHFVPVLELHLEDAGAGHHRLTAHVPFLPDQREQAEAEAKRLHRGQRITVRTQLTDIRLLLPAATFTTA